MLTDINDIWTNVTIASYADGLLELMKVAVLVARFVTSFVVDRFRLNFRYPIALRVWVMFRPGKSITPQMTMVANDEDDEIMYPTNGRYVLQILIPETHEKQRRYGFGNNTDVHDCHKTIITMHRISTTLAIRAMKN